MSPTAITNEIKDEVALKKALEKTPQTDTDAEENDDGEEEVGGEGLAAGK